MENIVFCDWWAKLILHLVLTQIIYFLLDSGFIIFQDLIPFGFPLIPPPGWQNAIFIQFFVAPIL